MDEMTEPVTCDACQQVTELSEIKICDVCKKGVCLDCVAGPRRDLCIPCGDSDDRWARSGGRSREEEE